MKKAMFSLKSEIRNETIRNHIKVEDVIKEKYKCLSGIGWDTSPEYQMKEELENY